MTRFPSDESVVLNFGKAPLVVLVLDCHYLFPPCHYYFFFFFLSSQGCLILDTKPG